MNQAQIVELDQAERAAQADAEVTAILAWMNEAIENGSAKQARLGRLLLEVSERELYRVLGFSSFDRWLSDRTEKHGRLRRTQSYAYLMVARHLLPHVDEKQFEAIGINKARVIANAIKMTGLAPKPELIEAAARPEVTESQLRQQVVEAYSLPEPEVEDGHWYDLGVLGAIYATRAEWGEITRGLGMAAMTDPIMPNDASDSAKLKDCLLKLSREYQSSWGPEVEGAEA